MYLNTSMIQIIKRGMTLKKAIPKALRMKLWEETFGDTLYGTCYCCDRDLKIDCFEAGHVVAEKHRGETTIDNLKVVCKPCNTSCGTKNLEAFKKLFLRRKEKNQEELQNDDDNNSRPKKILKELTCCKHLDNTQNTENIPKLINKDEIDIYLKFLRECTEDAETHVSKSSVFETFKSWFVANNPNARVPSNREFTMSIKKYKVIKKVRIGGSVVYGIEKLKFTNQ